MKQLIGAAGLSLIIIAAAFTSGCNKHKEAISVNKEYKVPGALQATLKDVPATEHTDTIVYNGAIARIKAEAQIKDSISFVTKLTIYKTEKDSITVKGILQPPAAATSPSGPSIQGNIIFWESSIGRSKLISRPFEVAANGTIIKQ